MAKLQSSFKNMFISLFTVCFTVAVLLSQVYKMTAKPIAEANALRLQNAISEVVPGFDNDPAAEAFVMSDGQGDSLLVYPAKRGDEVVGFAINSLTRNGFSGEISIMVGFDMEHRIVNYSILQHAETPGLGSKMGEWFKDETKPSQLVIGKDLSKGKLAITKDGGTIDAITASTITSRAFLEAVNRAYAVYSGGSMDATSGATQSEAGITGTTQSGSETSGSAEANDNDEQDTTLQEGGNSNE